MGKGAANKKVNNHIEDEFEGEDNINGLESDQSKDRLREIAFIIAFVLKSPGCSFRVNEIEEESGLDISQHNKDAYGEKTGSPTTI